MPDLFISYSSHDRPWAERLFDDLKTRFPTIRIFWDRASIAPGANWSQELRDNAKQATHFAFFWSAKAKASHEVGPEIETFRANAEINPTADGKTKERIPFYIALDAEEK